MLNFLLELVILVAVLGMIATGLTIRFVLPPGSRGGRGLSLWGLDRHEWGDLHFWIAVSLGVLLAAHVALHWAWVCALTQRWLRRGPEKPGRLSLGARSVYGMVFLVVLAALVAGFLWLASTQVVSEGPEGPPPGRGRHRLRAGAPGGALFSSPHMGRPGQMMYYVNREPEALPGWDWEWSA
jgi:hypothetical protein